MSKVDVVVPCYNYGHFLEACVSSVLNQEGVDVRVLIIDDASRDDSAEVAARLAARDPRVEFHRHAANKGHIATYNEGLLDWACSEYSLLLSADDLLTRGALLRATRVMDAHPDVGFTFGRAIATADPRWEDTVAPADYDWQVFSSEAFWRMSCRGAENLVPTPTLVVRTALQKRLGGYLPSLPHTGDFEMVLRFAAYGRVGYVACDQAFYRVHGNNMHKQTFSSAFRVLDQHRLAVETLYEAHADRIPRPKDMRKMLSRGMAMSALQKAARLWEQGDTRSCERLLNAALEVHPPLRREYAWIRLRARQALGPTLASAVERQIRRIRKPAAARDVSPFGKVKCAAAATAGGR